MKLIITGQKGKMGQGLAQWCDIHGQPYAWFSPSLMVELGEKPVAVHFGSERQVSALLDWCMGWPRPIPIIWGSTGQDHLVKNPPVPVFLVPNLAVEIMQLFEALPELRRRLPHLDVRITESHQSTKTSTPGTAVQLAKIFSQPYAAIKSIRDQALQMLLGVPAEHLSGHAYHWLTLSAPDLEIEIRTRVHGRIPYFRNVPRLAEQISAIPELHCRCHSLSESLMLLTN